MKRVIYMLLLSCLVSSVNAMGAEDPEAARLVREIKARGAKAVVARLAADEEMTKFEKVCGKIETAKQEWLEVARLLYPGSDGVTAESLETSLARALPKAPRRVLDLILESERDPKGGFRVDSVCAAPFIEPEPGVAEKHLLEAEDALESTNTINNRKLYKLRLKCLKHIQVTIDDMKKHGQWHPK